MTTSNYNDVIICVVTPEQLECIEKLQEENMRQGQNFSPIYNITIFQMNN